MNSNFLGFKIDKNSLNGSNPFELLEKNNENHSSSLGYNFIIKTIKAICLKKILTRIIIKICFNNNNKFYLSMQNVQFVLMYIKKISIITKVYSEKFDT